jgi:hypothetical protein
MKVDILSSAREDPPFIGAFGSGHLIVVNLVTTTATSFANSTRDSKSQSSPAL